MAYRLEAANKRIKHIMSIDSILNSLMETKSPEQLVAYKLVPFHYSLLDYNNSIERHMDKKIL